MRNPLIASRLFNIPLMVLPDKLDAVIFGLQERIGIHVEDAPEPSMYLTQSGERREPGYQVIDGVAVIEVFGGLAHRGGLQADSSYILGYQTIARRLTAALEDSGVHTVLMVLDSPGGEVSGVFSLAEQIYNARGTKRIVAAVSDMACSAGYLIASACGEVYASETACLGSIGVVMRHVDQSKRIEKMGMTITHIFMGDHKVDGNPFEPLPEDVRARYQNVCIKLYTMFTQRVALYLGMDVQAVINTQAAVYVGDESLNVGLANGVESTDETISRLISERGGAGSRQTITGMETSTMSTEKKEPKAGQVTKPAATAAASEPTTTSEVVEQPAAATEQPAAVTSDVQADVPDGAALERTRIKTIMSSDHAKGREEQASHLAYETEMSADAAIKVLASGVSAVKPAGNKLDKVMANTQQPDVGAEGGEQAEMSDSARILSDLNASRGIKKQGAQS